MITKNQIVILTTFIGAIIAFHIFGYIGHYGYDDLQYAKLAIDFKNGIVDYNDHFTFRTTIILLTSLSYLVFGVSDFASSVPAIFISIFILFIVFSILKEKGNKPLIIGLALTTLSNWFLFYSDKLMPDVYIALAVIVSLYVIHQYRYKNRNNGIFIYSMLLNLALLFGFMSKGTIILIIPLLAYYFITDIIQKKHIMFWMYNLIIGVVMFFGYLLVIKLLTGNYLQRFEAISNNSYLNLCSYDQQSKVILVKRISYEFFNLLISQEMAIGFIFLFAFLIAKKSLACFKMKDSFSFWITSSLLLLLSSNFMSISLTSYSPMCLDPRHYLFLIPVVSIPASIIITDYFNSKENKISILVLTATVAVISSFLQGNSFLHFYLPFFLIILAYVFIPVNRLNKNLFILAAIIVLSVQPFLMIKSAQKIKYKTQKQIFTEYILNANDTLLVITNDVQKRLGNYYNAYNNNGLITIENYNEFKYDSTDTRKKILFINWYTQYLAGLDFHDLPFYAKNISEDNKLLFQDNKLNLSLYEMTNFSIPERTGRILLRSLNDFEGNIAYWYQNKDDISDEVFFQGQSSIQVQEFSSTFEYAVDSLPLKNLNQLIVSCKLYCNYSDKTSSKLVISVEDSNGAYIWEGIEINKYLKAYSNWWPVKHEISINEGELKKNSKIKVYLWNLDHQEAYIDNFTVEILGQYK